jgi:hypothetical protein
MIRTTGTFGGFACHPAMMLGFLVLALMISAARLALHDRDPVAAGNGVGGGRSHAADVQNGTVSDSTTDLSRTPVSVGGI